MKLKHSRIVEIRTIIDNAKVARLGKHSTVEMIYNQQQICSTFKNGGVLKGLTDFEERNLLPKLIGISTTSHQWEEKIKSFWIEMTIDIPTTLKGNNKGLELEVGFHYGNITDAKAGLKEEEIENKLFNKALEQGRYYEQSFAIRLEKGLPINLSDYVKYRFILEHPLVANSSKILNPSTKELYYIYSSSIENISKRSKLDLQNKATTEYLLINNDNPTKIPHILALMQKELNVLNSTSKLYEVESKTGRSVTLSHLAREYPERFLSIVEDEFLLEKSFVENCIIGGHLKRQYGSDTITYNNIHLGNSLNETIIFLREEKNREIKLTLESKLANWKSLIRDVPVSKDEIETEIEIDEIEELQ